MKKFLIALTLMTSALSTQVHAQGGTLSADMAGFTLSPLLPFAATSALSSALSTSAQEQKEARQILNEGQEYLQTKEKGPLISKRVEELQEDQDMSDDEAVDFLMEEAAAILN